MSRRFAVVVVAVSLVWAVAYADARNQESAPAFDLRSAWLASRPSSAAEATRPSRSRRRSKASSRSSARATAARIGVGYTVFEYRVDGATVRSDPRRVFASGDRIRLLIEPAVNGYLYIFHVEGVGGIPRMLFPSVRLNGGVNVVVAHRPIEVPSRAESDPINRWFVFDQMPATEHLFLIVTRDPLIGSPTGKDRGRGRRTTERCGVATSAGLMEAYCSRAIGGFGREH
ncbi:MAG: DUF4384 domain-containing protein [Blastocatellia bacterium]|nr:DUF4384 domain-containing protein [Blastocatellia bacterium]